jgi:uncharacterized membrane protein YtjA (UPF0391 family)
MLKWAVIILIIALIAGIFGFADVEAASATIAKWLFGIFIVLFLGALIIGLTVALNSRPDRKLPSTVTMTECSPKFLRGSGYDIGPFEQGVPHG